MAGIAIKKNKLASNAQRNGAIASGATLTALTTQHAIRESIREAAEIKRTPNAKNFNAFLKSLQPGDVLFSRSTLKQRHILDVKQLLQGGMGSRHYHASMFIGKGRIAEHPGAGFKSWMPHARVQLARSEDVVAYRPKVSDEVKQAAVSRVKGLINRPYISSKEVFKTGVRSLIGLPPKVCGAAPGSPISCVTVPQTAYKEVFGDRFKSISDMRANPNMEMVSRLQRGNADPRVTEKALYRVGHGILKNLKWAALAGVLAVGATYAFSKYMASKKSARKPAAKVAAKKAAPRATAENRKPVRFAHIHGRVVPIFKKGA